MYNLGLLYCIPVRNVRIMLAAKSWECCPSLAEIKSFKPIANMQIQMASCGYRGVPTVPKSAKLASHYLAAMTTSRPLKWSASYAPHITPAHFGTVSKKFCNISKQSQLSPAALAFTQVATMGMAASLPVPLVQYPREEERQRLLMAQASLASANTLLSSWETRVLG